MLDTDAQDSIVFESSDEWEIKATLSDGSECDWLTISPAQSTAGQASVMLKTVSSNKTGDPRTATLTLYGHGKALLTLSVSQVK